VEPKEKLTIGSCQHPSGILERTMSGRCAAAAVVVGLMLIMLTVSGVVDWVTDQF